MFTGDETVLVRTAKAWDILHSGTVPVLLTFVLKLARFGAPP
jgi:hypothetical protein